jgi:pantoate kinase
MRAKAFCPGHVTGFFQTCMADDLLSSGSRGAGMCLSLGATSVVRTSDSSRLSVEVSVNGQPGEAEVTRAAVRGLLGERDLRVSVDTMLELPLSQGFGMSAAGALSATIALADIVGESRQRAFEAAHAAEVECRCGLGDVPALHAGGITIRVRPGLPPSGEVRRIEGTPDVVLCVIGAEMRTREVLNNEKLRQRIDTHGGQCVDRLLANPTLDNLLSLSALFARETGLASGRVADAVAAAAGPDKASMAMLGGSVFAVGDIGRLQEVLNGFGRTYLCRVEEQGPRLLP